jgi:hypothetical protein
MENNRRRGKRYRLATGPFQRGIHSMDENPSLSLPPHR